MNGRRWACNAARARRGDAESDRINGMEEIAAIKLFLCSQRKRSCRKPQRSSLFIALCAHCFLYIRLAGTTNLSDLQQCPQYTYALARNCSKNGMPIPNTAERGCCTLAKQANDAKCYCDSMVVMAGQSAGLTGSDIQTSLTQICQVPMQDLHIFNVSGCVALPPLETDIAPAPSEMQCQQLTDPLFKDCNSTSNPECCKLAIEANTKQCFCDPTILDAGREVSMTTTAIQHALVFCRVATADINVLDIGGCSGAPQPAVAPNSDLALCQRIMFAIFRDCSFEAGDSRRDFTGTSECCELVKQANTEFCFCDKVSYKAAIEIGVEPEAFAVQMSESCSIPPQNFNLVNSTGCAAGPPPGVTRVHDVTHCQSAVNKLMVNCQSIIPGAPVSNLTLAAECCRLSREANEAYCYCDYGLVSAGVRFGVTPTTLTSSLHDFCEVPLPNLNIVNVSGCDPLAAPFLPPQPGSPRPAPTPGGNSFGAASKQGSVSMATATAATVLATLLPLLRLSFSS